MQLHYITPWYQYPEFVKDLLLGKRRSFREDAQAWLAAQQTLVRAQGEDWILPSGPGLITMNHYSRPGFQAWWSPLAISALVPAEIHWVMTEAWTHAGGPFAHLRTAASRQLLARIARVYGFTSMPAMPPKAGEEAARATAVRALIGYAKRTPKAIIGLAPEGYDNPEGGLMWPPPGAGRMMLLLARIGLCLQPAGVFESEGGLCVSFGRPYRLEVPEGLPPDERDRLARETVMRRIAALVPAELRGEFEDDGGPRTVDPSQAQDRLGKMTMEDR